MIGWMSCMAALALVLALALMAAEASAVEEVAGSEPKRVSVTIDPTRPTGSAFGGFGFHAFFPIHKTDQEHYEQVLTKRWGALRPSFARLTHYWTGGRPGVRDAESLQRLVRACKMMAATNTEIYLTTWNPADVEAGEPREAYAAEVVDELEYLIRDQGCDNIRWYCMTNELTLNTWSALSKDLETFKDYHRLIDAELKRRDLDVKLLATDASPLWNWSTIGWAAKNMDDITGAYGGHHYANDFHPNDPAFYPMLLERFTWGAGVARAKGKPFIIGEFGAKQSGGERDGKRWDACAYWDTPDEPMVGVQMSEAMIAALNAGVYSLSYWTFTDFPADFSKNYANHWGVFQWKDRDNRIRSPYFAIGLMTRFFQRCMTAASCQSSDPLVRVGAAVDTETRRWSVAVVNRGPSPATLKVHFTAYPPEALGKYVYDPASPPVRTDGRLQDPVGECAVEEGVLTDIVGSGQLVVYAVP